MLLRLILEIRTTTQPDPSGAAVSSERKFDCQVGLPGITLLVTFEDVN